MHHKRLHYRKYELRCCEQVLAFTKVSTELRTRAPSHFYFSCLFFFTEGGVTLPEIYMGRLSLVWGFKILSFTGGGGGGTKGLKVMI